MKKYKTFSEIVTATIRGDIKNYEPVPRKCAGVFGYVYHRFPIKGGISSREVLIRQMGEKNALYDILKKEGK